jgi:hypothetical protein
LLWLIMRRDEAFGFEIGDGRDDCTLGILGFCRVCDPEQERRGRG